VLRTEQQAARRVVIVDDSQVVQQRLMAMLSSASPVSVVGVADDVDGAVKVIGETRPDAVILDLGLGNRTGFEVLERLREQPGSPAVIVLTNSAHEEYRRRCLELGATAFLDKSSEFDHMLATLFTVPPAPQASADPAKRSCWPGLRCQHQEVRRNLHEREALYRALAEATSDAIVVLEDGIVREVSGLFTSRYGYFPADVVGLSALEFVAPASRAKAAESIARQLEGTYELQLLTKQGEPRDVTVTARMHHANDRTLRLLALHDVTARRQLERQFQQAQKMEAVGRLAGNAAHDFNNVLTAIGGLVELALQELPEGHPVRADLRSALGAVAQGTALARQLQNLGRPHEEEGGVCDPNEVLASDDLMLRRLAGESVQFITRLANPLPNVTMAATSLRQCLTNMVINARDAMPNGGTLTIETARESLGEDSPLGLPAGRYVRIAVGDSGTGMSPEVQSRIFEPFFTTKEQKGTGLGLASVYGLVTRAGGTVTVHSMPGHGSRFEILLPEAPRES
jgi:two-component system, cell cycle sensor histidine kinase and response regulator CckA